MIAIFHRSPARDANRANNALSDPGRAARWRSVRDAAWELLDPLLAPGAAVAIVGAGNADDLPLTRITVRAGRVDLVDVDAAAARAAAGREPGHLAARIRVVECDITDGVADAVVRAARYGHPPPVPAPGAGDVPIESDAYDLVVGDLFYSQLLYPGLKRLGVTPEVVATVLRSCGPALTEVAVRRLHASTAPGGRVVHLHDVACWSDASPQPHPVRAVLERPEQLVGELVHPTGCDPEDALAAIGARVVQRAWWSWPFARSATYLVRASVATHT